MAVLHLTQQAAGQLWPLGHGLPTPDKAQISGLDLMDLNIVINYAMLS